MNKLEFFEIIDAICCRPGLYTPSGSFYEAVSYIVGLASSNLELGQFAGHSKMTPFLNWLAGELGENPARFGWKEFRERYHSDLTAFAELPKLYRKFIGEGEDMDIR